MTAPLTPAEIASMVADANTYDTALSHNVSAFDLTRYVRALAAECERLRAECEQWKQTLMDTLTGYNEDRLAPNHPLRLELTEARAQLEAVTRELVANRENEHAIMGDLLRTREERDRYKAALEWIGAMSMDEAETQAAEKAREALKGAG